MLNELKGEREGERYGEIRRRKLEGRGKIVREKGGMYKGE